MPYQFDEGYEKMVCRDCIHRKYDKYISDTLIEGYRASSCTKYLRKPLSIYEYWCECGFYQPQNENEDIEWNSKELGDEWYQLLINDYKKR